MTDDIDPDDVLDEHGLEPEQVWDYVDAIVRMNQVEAAEEMDVPRWTVRKCKQAFADMTAEERAAVLEAVSERSEGSER